MESPRSYRQIRGTRLSRSTQRYASQYAPGEEKVAEIGKRAARSGMKAELTLNQRFFFKTRRQELNSVEGGKYSKSPRLCYQCWLGVKGS